MGKRTTAVVFAVVLAGMATVALAGYIRGIEVKAIESQEPVQAYVAREVIPAGKSGEAAAAENLIARVAVPRKVLAEGAVLSLAEIKDRIAAVNILKGEQILKERFVPKGQARGILTIPADREAYSVEVAVPPGVAGFVQAGDHVSIVAKLDVPGPNGPETRVQYLLKDIQVLAVGQRVVTTETREGDRQQTQQQGRVLLTLALTPVEIEKLAFAVLQGEIHFTLLPPGAQPTDTPGRTRGSAFS